jgi:WD40-like Beta Propeller Repeat
VSHKSRVAVLVTIVLVAVLGSIGYVVYARHRQASDAAHAPKVPTMSLAAVADVPHLVFRSTALGDGYGEASLVPLSDPDGPRAFTGTPCDRLYARQGEEICLAARRAAVTTYKSQLLDPSFKPVRDLPLSGLPSRARLSPDGTLTATTTFVYGDSYTNPGQFSTRTLIVRSDGQLVADIEQFRFTVDGRTNDAKDRNMWGVTFADDNTFYATAASGGKTWLVRGSLSARTLTALHEDVECPSLSPDGTRIAFKQRGTLPRGHWHLAVYDLATGHVTLLAEQRSVDDQVEWLDNNTILYGMPRIAPNGADTDDIWAVPADGSGTSRVFVHNAWSPAVVR